MTLHELGSRLRCGLAVLALFGAATSFAAMASASEEPMHEQIVRVPLPPEAGSPGLIATTYRPPGDGPGQNVRIDGLVLLDSQLAHIRDGRRRADRLAVDVH